MIGPIHHSSRTVSNMERSLAFYRDLLGFQVVEDITSGEPGIQEASATPEGQLRIVMLEAGGSHVELIEFLKEKGKPYDNPVELNDVGSSHIAFEPEDMDQAYEYLLSKGVRFTSPPRVTWREPGRYWRATVFYDPDGFDLALFKSYQGEPAEMGAASS
ncbi:MAG: VOC family protein [Nitrospinota bacterium]